MPISEWVGPKVALNSIVLGAVVLAAFSTATGMYGEFMFSSGVLAGVGAVILINRFFPEVDTP